MLKFMKAYALATILTLGLVSFLAPRAAAQDGKISGTIIGLDGKPWANEPVKIKSDQGAVQEVKTDDKGQFIFPNLRSGKYTFTAAPPQFKTPFEVVIEIRGTESQPINLNFKDIAEKQNPEAAAAMRKQEEEQAKTVGMKEHFASGMAILNRNALPRPT